jgi:L-ascorbate metabolism protein UlaG (beta-lactamase superfamily)
LKTFKKVLTVTVILLTSLVVVLVVTASLFIRLSPQFGGRPTAEQVKAFENSGHYANGIFVNEIPTSMEMGFGKVMSILKDYVVGVPNQAPKTPLPVLPVDSLTIANKPDTLTRLTWFGHSSFLLEINGKNILIDPMFGPAPSPHPWLGKKRFTQGLPIAIEKLPHIDAVIYSHDHYDHLDYGSVQQLKGKVSKFYTPLGVSAHLRAWGVSSDDIHELNWWEEVHHEELRFVCTPARHFSGRGLNDRFATLWASWIVQSDKQNIFFSGDSGYGPHFKTIGEKYGPFDFAMMECGQYDQRWANIHMMPEETVQAAVDVKTKVMMPIHWGAFVLALHPWKDPIERVTKKAVELSVPLATPQLGEPVVLDIPEKPSRKWWEEIE